MVLEIARTRTLARVVSQSARDNYNPGAVCVDPQITEKVYTLHIK